jgi:S-adenosylmethionine-diacylgycerolhomoserine-N-methlytransferase
LHIIDFGGQEALPHWFRAGLRRWLAHFQVTPCDQLEPELRTRAGLTRASLVVERPFRSYAQYAVLSLP